MGKMDAVQLVGSLSRRRLTKSRNKMQAQGLLNPRNHDNDPEPAPSSGTAAPDSDSEWGSLDELEMMELGLDYQELDLEVKKLREERQRARLPFGQHLKEEWDKADAAIKQRQQRAHFNRLRSISTQSVKSHNSHRSTHAVRHDSMPLGREASAEADGFGLPGTEASMDTGLGWDVDEEIRLQNFLDMKTRLQAKLVLSSWRKYMQDRRHLSKEDKRLIELKELLDLAPEARQQQDLEAMCSGLRANHNTFFVDLPDEVLLELCKTIYAAEYEPGVKVYCRGDEASIFCVVLSGKVGVFSGDWALDEATGKPDKGEHIRSLVPGNAFGASALVGSFPRKESVVALTTAVVAVVRKEVYLDVLQDVSFLEMKGKMDFLCRVPVFQRMSFMDMQEMLDMLVPVNFVSGQPLFKQGEVALHTFFIIEGTVEVFCDMPAQVGSAQIRRERIGKLTSFDYVGEAGCLSVARDVHSVSATAELPTKCYSLSKYDLLMVLPKIKPQFMMYSLQTRLTEGQVARSLLEKARWLDYKGDVMKLEMTHKYRAKGRSATLQVDIPKVLPRTPATSRTLLTSTSYASRLQSGDYDPSHGSLAGKQKVELLDALAQQAPASSPVQPIDQLVPHLNARRSAVIRKHAQNRKIPQSAQITNVATGVMSPMHDELLSEIKTEMMHMFYSPDSIVMLIRISIDKQRLRDKPPLRQGYGTVMIEPIALTGMMSKMVDVFRHKYKMRCIEWNTDTFVCVSPVDGADLRAKVLESTCALLEAVEAVEACEEVHKRQWPGVVLHCAMANGPLFTTQFSKQSFVREFHGPAYENAHRLLSSSLTHMPTESCVRIPVHLAEVLSTLPVSHINMRAVVTDMDFREHAGDDALARWATLRGTVAAIGTMHSGVASETSAARPHRLSNRLPPGAGAGGQGDRPPRKSRLAHKPGPARRAAASSSSNASSAAASCSLDAASRSHMASFRPETAPAPHAHRLPRDDSFDGDHPPFVTAQDSAVRTAGAVGADVRGGDAPHGVSTPLIPTHGLHGSPLRLSTSAGVRFHVEPEDAQEMAHTPSRTLRTPQAAGPTPDAAVLHPQHGGGARRLASRGGEVAFGSRTPSRPSSYAQTHRPKSRPEGTPKNEGRGGLPLAHNPVLITSASPQGLVPHHQSTLIQGRKQSAPCPMPSRVSGYTGPHAMREVPTRPSTSEGLTSFDRSNKRLAATPEADRSNLMSRVSNRTWHAGSRPALGRELNPKEHARSVASKSRHVSQVHVAELQTYELNELREVSPLMAAKRLQPYTSNQNNDFIIDSKDNQPYSLSEDMLEVNADAPNEAADSVLVPCVARRFVLPGGGEGSSSRANVENTSGEHSLSRGHQLASDGVRRGAYEPSAAADAEATAVAGMLARLKRFGLVDRRTSTPMPTVSTSKVTKHQLDLFAPHHGSA